ncbi:hypothetical protein OE88DRAFT_1038131 [Heliocybe sulcata]|uniref:Mixed lineage kinase domain-containing protein n=1 Tax=Heliocybe sulcata TaxID=5364 RepID=A0A5C3MLH4_9AGAM|nr:hypothetical protein OE88DRAFT_1038131 [Heliocybe sulcata]
MPGWRFGKRKKGRNRPPDEGHQERRVPLEQAQAVLEVASALVDGSVVNMPILKPVFEAARQVITICQAMRSNKDDAASLAHEVQEFLQHLSDALVTEVQEHIDGRLQADLNKFTDALEKIHIRLRKLSGRSKAANFWRYKSDRDTINDCRRILNHDGKLFMVRSVS